MLFRGTAIVSALTLLSRLLGFVRDLLVARLLGASMFADAFFVAFRIPNLLRSFVAEGALTSAFTPVFSTSVTQGNDRARDTCRRVSGFLLVVTSILTVVLISYAPSIVRLFAPGFSAEGGKFELCVTLTRMMAPYIACVSFIAMLNAALNTLGIFGASAWAQVIMNLVLIVGAICAMPCDLTTATIILAASVLVGGIAQIIAQAPACARARLSLRPSFAILVPEIAELVRLMIPATIGASIYQITIFMATALASLLSSGSVSWLFYADRIAQFPIGIFSIALASVLLPALSNASAQKDEATFYRSLSDSLRFTSFFIIPMAAGLWSLSLPIIQVLFERGAFNHDSSIRTSHALRALALGLWATSCHSMIIRAFIAKKDTRTPTIIGACSLMIYLCASLLLIGPLAPHIHPSRLVSLIRNLQTSLIYISPISADLGHVGLALASSIAAFGSLVLVVIMFSVKIQHFPWRAFLSAITKTLIASCVMTLGVRYCVQLTHVPLLQCIYGASIGVSLFLAVSYILRSQELLDTIATILRRRTAHSVQS